MPAKNSIKTYIENSFYHIYNRGVAKNKIFLDTIDCSVFLSYLKDYLSPKDVIGLNVILSSSNAGYKEKYEASKLLHLKNYFGEIELLAYALMPNHFHLLIKQSSPNSIDNFMSSFATRYSGYFNRKYKRVGSISQGVYKAAIVESDEQLLHLSRYIHLNPRKKSDLPNSLPDYLGQRRTTWIKTEYVLGYFNKSNPQKAYAEFVKGSEDLEPIIEILLDSEDS